MSKQHTGIYLVTNHEPFDVLMAKLHLLCAKKHSIELLQYRRKHLEKPKQIKELNQLVPFCEQQEITLIINDDVALAKQFAVGVHLGQSDGSLQEARASLGKHAMIGRTCHQSLALATQAEKAGASYAAFGVYQPSKNKPNAKQVSTDLLSHASRSLGIPSCVIGGVTLADVPALHSMGVRYFAMIDALLAGNEQQIKQNARDLAAWCEQCI